MEHDSSLEEARGVHCCLSCRTLPSQFIVAANAKNGVELWHKILGHMSQKGLDILLSSQKSVTKGNKLDFCSDCLYGKQVKSSYNTDSSKQTTPFEHIHFDFCIMPTKSLEGSLHLVLPLMITLESIRHIYWRIILKCFLIFRNSIRTDNGGEYINN